jgi:hypothetical protein
MILLKWNRSEQFGNDFKTKHLRETCMGEERYAYRVLTGYSDGKRSMAKPRLR